MLPFAIKDYVLAAFAAFSIATSVGWYVTAEKLEDERAAHELTKVTYENAQLEAENKALKQKQETEKKYDEIKEQADKDYDALLGKYNASLVRYQQAIKSAASGTNLSIPPESPGSTEGAGEDTLVPTRLEDLKICAENTAKAVIAHVWVHELEQIE